MSALFAASLLPVVPLFFTPDGFVPMSIIGNYPSRWSFHFISTEIWWQYTLVCTMVVASLAYAAGYKNRILSIVLWLLFLSLYIREKPLFNTGEKILFWLYLWAIFLETDRVWTYKNWRSKSTHLAMSIKSYAHTAYGIQLVLVFWVSVVFKLQNSSWVDGTAVYKALYGDNYTRNFAAIIRTIWPQWTIAATHITMLLEVAGPILILLGLYKAKLWRFTAVSWAATASLIISFNLCFSFGFFTYFMLALILPFIPSQMWEAIMPNTLHKKVLIDTHRYREILAIVLIILITWGNLWRMNYRWFPIPAVINKMVMAPLYLKQNWAVYVQTNWVTRWIVLEAQTESGQKLDAWKWYNNLGTSTVDLLNEPANFPTFFGSARWRNYFYFRVHFEPTVQSVFMQKICKEFNTKFNDQIIDMKLHMLSHEVIGINNFLPIKSTILKQEKCSFIHNQ